MPKVYLVKQFQPQEGYNGDVVYTYTLRNDGDCDLTNVTVISDADGIYSDSEYGRPKNGNFVIDTLERGQEVIVIFTVPAEVTIPGKLVNNVKVTCKEELDYNNKASFEKRLIVNISEVGLDVKKLADKKIHFIGEKAIFTTRVENIGQLPITNITIQEDLDGEYTMGQGTAILNGDNVVISKLEPGESYDYSYDFQ